MICGKFTTKSKQICGIFTTNHYIAPQTKGHKKYGHKKYGYKKRSFIRSHLHL